MAFFGYFSPSHSWTISLNKAYVVIWIFGYPLTCSHGLWMPLLVPWTHVSARSKYLSKNTIFWILFEWKLQKFINTLHLFWNGLADFGFCRTKPISQNKNKKSIPKWRFFRVTSYLQIDVLDYNIDSVDLLTHEGIGTLDMARKLFS